MEISEKRLGVAFAAIFMFGVLFSFINGYYVQSTGSQLPILVYALIFIAIGVGAFIILLFQWKINQRQLERVLRILPSDERMVLEVLVREKRLEQAYLVAETGLSKVKVSRVTSKLEQRGVVKKKRGVGNTNLVVLDI